MVHSVELLFDAETEAAIRGIWNDLADAGIRSLAGHRSPTNRPHVTLTVADHLGDGVNEALRPVLDLLPLSCVIGAPMVFGAGPSFTVVRLVVPSLDLLAVHAEVHRTSLSHMAEGPLPHADPGRWTPHVTLARRVPHDRLAAALALPGVTRDIDATAVGLRHWDGDRKVVHPIGGPLFVAVSQRDPLAAPLLDGLTLEYRSRYGSFLDGTEYQDLWAYPEEEFAPPGGALTLALVDGVPVAGGAFRRYDSETAELKRMWTSSAHRGKGYGKLVIAELERIARERGYRRVYLTTGPRQPEAVALYLSAGYTPLYDRSLPADEVGVHPFAKDMTPPR